MCTQQYTDRVTLAAKNKWKLNFSEKKIQEKQFNSLLKRKNGKIRNLIRKNIIRQLHVQVCEWACAFENYWIVEIETSNEANERTKRVSKCTEFDFDVIHIE